MATKRNKKWARVSGTDLTQMKDRAAKCIVRGDWYNALRALLVARSLAPKDTYIARKIGDVYQRLGRVEEAVEAYKIAARLFAEGGFLHKAISVNNIVLALQPDDKEVAGALAALRSDQPASKEKGTDQDGAESAHASKVIGLYLDSLTKETMPWFPMLSDLLEEEVNLVFDLMARKNKRLTLLRRVDFELDGKARFAYTRDLSAGGAYLRTPENLPEDISHAFSFHLIENAEPLMLKGRVVRSNLGREQLGFGVRFDADGQDPALASMTDFVLQALEEQALESLARDPDNVNSLYDLADIARERQQLDKTEGFLRRITELESPSIAHGYLGEVILARALESGEEALLKEANDLFSVAAQLDHREALSSVRTVLKERVGGGVSPVAGSPEQEQVDPFSIQVKEDDEHDLAVLKEFVHAQPQLDVPEGDPQDKEERLRRIAQRLEAKREDLWRLGEQLNQEGAQLKEREEILEKRAREIELWAADLLQKEKEIEQRTKEDPDA